MVKITLPDGNIKEFENSTNALEIARSISEGLARMCVAAKINGVLSDLTTTIEDDCEIELLTPKNVESLEILRHTTAHVFAQAMGRVFPNAKITIGPAIEGGFYYDVDCDELVESDLPKIEAEMQKIIKENLDVKKSFKSKSEALEFFKDNEYKTEIIESLSAGTLSEEEKGEGSVIGDEFQFYGQGDFSDLCRGPHLPRTGLIKAFKLEKITKAYWRGNTENKQLNRVYGTAFWKKSELIEHFEMLQEAKKRDHRIIGKKMDLFMTHEYAPGMTFFLPKGFQVYRTLQNFIRDLYKKYEFKEVMTPNMFNKKLWETSGHWEHYKDDMFVFDVEGQEFSLKPMNCPSHCLIFKNDFRSYKELPMRIADFGALHRNELSGALSGMTRVRKFCQDDAHIFCTMAQVEDEIAKCLEFVDYVYNDVFKMDYEIELSTRPEKRVGSEEVWDKAEKSLAAALDKTGKKYEICEGDGAFYGPKIDFRIRDCLKRVWQTATIQLDFNLPDRFDLKFQNENSTEEQPVMIHRAVLGSLERFMAVMIENFAGKFPLWLAPNQVEIINVADRHQDYCNEIKTKLVESGFRVETNFDNLGVGKKIAIARDERKPNYTLVLGDENIKEGNVSVRTREVVNGRNVEFTSSIEEFISRLVEERDSKSITF
ncbi:MAG: threonine--tRNA ligase [Nanoarchaeales archaeon]|nr:threonine--tRNA ligase [Nanoarchaeales archaeon]